MRPRIEPLRLGDGGVRVVSEQRRHFQRHEAVDAVAVFSWIGANKSAARDKSCSASSKNSASPE